MSKYSIEWTEQTWNPVTGCTKVVRVVSSAMRRSLLLG